MPLRLREEGVVGVAVVIRFNPPDGDYASPTGCMPESNHSAVFVSIPLTGIMPLRPYTTAGRASQRIFVSIPLTGIMPLRPKAMALSTEPRLCFNPPDGDYASPTLDGGSIPPMSKGFQSP